MATETYWYFPPDTNLRSAFGGAAILNGGDTREITPAELTHRWVCQQLGLPADATRNLWRAGAASGVTWIRVPASYWAILSAKLSDSEVGNATQTMPTGWTVTSGITLLQPNPKRINWVVWGDSLSYGTSTTSGNTPDTWGAQAFGLLGEVFAWEDNGYASGKSKRVQFLNLSLGSSSWDNSVYIALNEDKYPRRQSLAFTQRLATMPLGKNCWMHYALGSNDPAYDSSVTGEIAWNRFVVGVGRFKDKFPDIPVSLETICKRSELTSLNNRIADLNDRMRANYASIGVAKVFDTEAKVPAYNITTGDTNNSTYYAAGSGGTTDGTHRTTYGNSLIAAAHAADLAEYVGLAA